MSHVPPDTRQLYTGLRTTPEEALTRMQLWNQALTPNDVLFYAIEFTPLGWMHATTTMRGTVPMLQRMAYSDPVDWGIYHFNAALPLEVRDAVTGDVIWSVTFHPGMDARMPLD